jgi:acyl-CoA-binding protein
MAGTMTVAKRKASKAVEPGRKPTALTIKGSLEWRAWVEKGAKACRTDVAKLVDASLVDYLKSRGFDDEPPAR